jgi:hypothetical protein
MFSAILQPILANLQVVTVWLTLKCFWRLLLEFKLRCSTAGGNVASTLKKMICERFRVDDIPDGYLFFPLSMGGLDV